MEGIDGGLHPAVDGQSLDETSLQAGRWQSLNVMVCLMTMAGPERCGLCDDDGRA